MFLCLQDSCAILLFGGKGNWTCKEEIQLLNGMEKFGFGNWELVSKHVETKTPEEVKEEYISRYLEGSIGRQTWGKVVNTRTVHCELQKDEGPLAPDVMSRLPPLDITLKECEQLGYMPNREDFERVRFWKIFCVYYQKQTHIFWFRSGFFWIVLI